MRDLCGMEGHEEMKNAARNPVGISQNTQRIVFRAASRKPKQTSSKQEKNMELLKNWKESVKDWQEQSRLKREKEVKRMAKELITLSDFAGSLYVAFGDNPLVALDGKTTAAEAVGKLAEIRANFIASKLAR